MQVASHLGLSQKQGREEKVVAYFLLGQTQRQYCATRRELLAVIKSLAHFHPYLYGRDHSSLRWLMNFNYAEGNGRPQWPDVSALSEITKNCCAQWDSLCLQNDIFCVESGNRRT